MVGATSPVPQWLQVLLKEKFFSRCHLHDSAKKNEKNVLCLDCCASICPQCLPHHESHSLLQIRRYVYRDVIRPDDAQKVLNCSLVQPYTTNGAKVVFLKQKPISRPFRGSRNLCATCNRSLQDNYTFCCLYCKVAVGLDSRTAPSANRGATMFRHSPYCNATSSMNRRKGIPRRSHLY